MANAANGLLDEIFAGELRELMVISYIVLGNNAVTNRFIERRFRIPVQAWSALYAIDRFPGIRAKEIREIFPRPQNTISRAVSLLEQRGYIVQEASDTDGREKRLLVTETGRALLADLIEASRRRQAELLEPLSEEERDTFFKLALKVASGQGLLRSSVMDT
ncbi:MarR family winged helix-turn-helix transcriptional regulator [Mesorhizobium sp. 10J20-29]